MSAPQARACQAEQLDPNELELVAECHAPAKRRCGGTRLLPASFTTTAAAPPTRALPASLTAAATAPPTRALPASLTAAATAPPTLPPLAYTDRVHYLWTALDVDNWAAHLLLHPPAALGWDVEWRVTYKTGQAPRAIALMQLCFFSPTPFSGGSPATSPTCLLLHVRYSGITPHLKQLLCSEDVLKVGVGAHGDALKMQRDFGLPMQGVLDLSEFANARLCSEGAACLPQKWSLAALTERLLGATLDKRQSLRCSDWEALPLSGEQQLYAATDAWASLQTHQRLLQMPVVWQPPALPPPLVPSDAQETAQPGSSAPGGSILPGCVPLQPAKLAVWELHSRQGWSFEQIADTRRIALDTAQAYVAEAICGGHPYRLQSLGIGDMLEEVATAAALLLGRPLSCSVPMQRPQREQGDTPCRGAAPPADLLAELLERTGGGGVQKSGIRQLKEAHFPAASYGRLRLALAHLGRCNCAPAVPLDLR